MSAQSYPALRTSIRSLENDLSAGLSSYSKLAAQASANYSSSGKLSDNLLSQCNELEEQVGAGLGKVRARPGSSHMLGLHVESDNSSLAAVLPRQPDGNAAGVPFCKRNSRNAAHIDAASRDPSRLHPRLQTHTSLCCARYNP
jgi:hypothetical protein